MKVKLALFTNQFPGRVNTFFARDVKALLNENISVDVFTIYPIRKRYWQYVPSILTQIDLSKIKIHQPSILNILQGFCTACKKPSITLRDVKDFLFSAKKYGCAQLVKTAYSIILGWVWAYKYENEYDYMLSYWGNYSATYAYVANRLLDRKIPFSFFLHAGTDLYRDQINLQEKIKYSDKVIVVCEYNKKFLDNLYPETYASFFDKLKLHHLGLDVSNYPLILEGRKKNRVLAVGRFDQQKGFDYLIRAFLEVQSQKVGCELVIVGDGNQKNALKNIVEELGLSSLVIFRGWLSFQEVMEEMKISTLLVHPSSSLGDAVPTVIKESMALGLPVIGSDIVGIPELLDYGRCGVLVPPKDIHALSIAIINLLDNDRQRKEMAINARKFAEQTFDMWKNGKALAEMLFEDL